MSWCKDKQCLSSARRPQSDGQTERTNRTLEDMLRHFVSPSHDDWDLRLPCCEFAINNAWNAATDSTPFFLNTGAHPRSPVNVNVVCKLPAVNSFVGKINAAIAHAKDSLKYAQMRMSSDYDAKHRAESFQVGEFAYLSPAGLNVSMVGSRKLLSRQLGPFEVIERIGRLAYKLLLPASMSRVHPVFHVSLLKRPRDGGRNTAPPPAMLLDGQEEHEIDKVLACRPKPHKRQPNHREYLVSWKGMGPEENEWFSEHKLKNAADAVQDFHNNLRSQGRPAPRLGMATDAEPNMQPANAASVKKKRGRPAKSLHATSTPARKQRKESGQSAVRRATRQSARLQQH